MTHHARIFHFPYSYEQYFDLEYSLDISAGVIAGDFPYYDEEMYGATVHDFKAQAAINITNNIKIGFFNLVKFDLELEITPFLI